MGYCCSTKYDDTTKPEIIRDNPILIDSFSSEYNKYDSTYNSSLINTFNTINTEVKLTKCCPFCFEKIGRRFHIKSCKKRGYECGIGNNGTFKCDRCNKLIYTNDDFYICENCNYGIHLKCCNYRM